MVVEEGNGKNCLICFAKKRKKGGKAFLAFPPFLKSTYFLSFMSMAINTRPTRMKTCCIRCVNGSVV